jgi:hypothetical protein
MALIIRLISRGRFGRQGSANRSGGRLRLGGQVDFHGCRGRWAVAIFFAGIRY